MKKKLLSLLCVVLLVVGAVAGTYAWLIDTDTAVNTFEVGEVKIDLDEAKVDEYGVAIPNEDRVAQNTYKLIPGHTYVKDPTVTVKENSEESYVRALVTFTCSEELDEIFPEADLTTIFKEYNSKVWEYVGTEEDEVANTRTYEFRYANTVETLNPKADRTLEPLFTGFTFPGDVTAEQLEDLKTNFTITVVAQAVQATIFEGDDDAAWAAFDAQYVPQP